MSNKRLTISILSLVALAIGLGSSAMFAQAPNVVEAICSAVPSMPFYGAGEFNEKSNCDSPFDSVNGNYRAQKLDGGLFAAPGRDSNNELIDVSDDGYFSNVWNIDTTRGILDSDAQASRATCPNVEGSLTSTLGDPFTHPGCVVSEGYAIPQQFSPATTGGWAKSYVVTPCYDIRVEITIHAGPNAPEERRREAMANAEKYALEATNALISATQTTCDWILNQQSGGGSGGGTQPPNNPPSNNPPSNSSAQPSLQIKTPQGTQTVSPGETTTISLPDGESAELHAECEGVYYFFLLIYEVEDGETNPFRFMFLGMGTLYATLCEWLMDTDATPANLQINSQSAHELIEIGITSGGIRVSSDVPVGAVRVSTPEATASSTGANNFTVKRSASTGTSTISSSRGSVSVTSNHGGSSRSVSSGQEVSASNNGISQPGPIGSTSPPNTTQPPSNNPPPSRSVSTGAGLAQFDANGNCTMGDSEFFSATDAWITEQISNELFFSAVDAWISQSSICTSTASVSLLKIESIKLSRSLLGSVFFDISGQGMSSTGIEIFDLQGQSVFSTSNAGTSLRWNLRDLSGAIVANGVYLYRVSVKNASGERRYSQLQKLVVMR